MLLKNKNRRKPSGHSIDSRLNQQKVRPRSNKKNIGIQFLKAGIKWASKTVFIFFATSLLLLAVYVGVAESSLFQVRSVEINGVQHLSRLDVLRASEVDSKTSLLRIKPEVIEEEILSTLPWVRKVQVTRILPGKLEINLEEEKPYALGMIEGDFYYLNQQMRPFAPFKYEKEYDLSFISGLSRAEWLNEDEHIKLMLQDVTKIITTFANDEVCGQVCQVQLDSSYGIQVVFESLPALVNFGEVYSDAQKLALYKVLADLKQRGELSKVISIDLKTDNVTVRLGS